MRHLIVVGLLVACDAKAQPTALDYVSLCTPGKPYEKCHDGLRRDRVAEKTALPAGDLVSIQIDAPALIDGQALPLDSTRAAYRHTMSFRDGSGTVRTRVMSLLQSKLGEPKRITTPPIADPACPPGDYWLAADGLWILSDTTATWYSNPIDGIAKSDGFPWKDTRLQKAPASGPLWNELGHLLVTY